MRLTGYVATDWDHGETHGPLDSQSPAASGGGPVPGTAKAVAKISLASKHGGKKCTARRSTGLDYSLMRSAPPGVRAAASGMAGTGGAGPAGGGRPARARCPARTRPALSSSPRSPCLSGIGSLVPGLIWSVTRHLISSLLWTLGTDVPGVLNESGTPSRPGLGLTHLDRPTARCGRRHDA